MQWRRAPVTLAFMLFALPASTTYEIHDFGFGSGGSGVTDSPTYSLRGSTGEVSAGQLSGSTYNLGPGLIFAGQSNTPAAPTFTNPSSHYNKLKFVLDTGGNPSDTLFAIAISTDDFVTTNFIQADNTISTTPVYQTYTTWGGAGGAFVIGLTSNTTYKIKVKAVQTKYSESAYSAAATAATLAPTLTYDLDVSASDSETSAPYTVAFGTLNIGSVTTASNKVWVDLTTNAEQGAFVYLYASGTGLSSATASHTITSATADLGSVNEGFGLQVDAVTQSAGGPLTAVSPYNSSAQNVGIVDTTSRTIFNSNAATITGGRGSFFVKAKASTFTPSANDYATTITMIASATF